MGHEAMLVQTYRRAVPEKGAFIERTLLREPRFCVAVIRARRIAVDRGVIEGAVKFAQRFRRPQVSISLDGGGYLQAGGRIVPFRGGDLVQTDQRLLTGEGYGGETSEVIILDWESSTERPTCASADVGAVSRADLRHLRGHVASLHTRPGEVWVEELVCRLRSLGLDVAPERRSSEPHAAPPDLARLYRAMGTVLSRLHEQPSLEDLALSVGLGDRQVKRKLMELTRRYAHPFASWRDFLHEMRLDWATQLLSVRGLPLERVAELAGYRSTIALHHAFSTRGAATPGTLARRLAERWGG